MSISMQLDERQPRRCHSNQKIITTLSISFLNLCVNQYHRASKRKDKRLQEEFNLVGWMHPRKLIRPFRNFVFHRKKNLSNYPAEKSMH